MSPPACVLLDLDGTLFDSRPGIFASFDAALRDLGHEPDPAMAMDFVLGPPISDVAGQILAHYGDTRAEELVTAYRRHYAASGFRNSALYPGIPALLDALRAAGCRLFLATSKRSTAARQMMDHAGLTPQFSALYGSEPGGALDHKPELIARILARESIAAAEAVMIGDRRFDMSGAQANHVRAIGALWGYGGREELEQAGADAIAASPEDVAALLLG
ncbi:HAD hydrolase-like protein [Roseomonas sp. BN140053]|uniref:HAD hydrolase-like protein n=1 Tax=Roseomonas sp. BN140053 TaxID=3391898 RepID=UPI0039EB3B94